MALVAAAPQAGRLLRPLCSMLAMELPEYLRLPPRPRPPRPNAAKKPEDRDVVASTSPLRFAKLINPEVDGKPNGHQPPNKFGYGGRLRFPKPDWAG